MRPAGWSGSPGPDTAAWYREFAAHAAVASPSYERLSEAVAGDPSMLAWLDALPEPKRQPNLLFAAVRFNGGPTGSYRQFRSWLSDHADAVRSIMLARRTQTNEPGRCATWLPALPAEPFALLEVGASAGLCLSPDLYAYAYATSAGEHRIGHSPLVLPCTAVGLVPLPGAVPHVVWRAGLDLNPLDVLSDDDVRWLESLIWPEETERFDRLHAAVAIARRQPPRVVVGDMVADLAALAAEAPADVPLIIVHTAALAYVDEPGRHAFVATVRSLARQRPIQWLSNEAPGVVPGTRVETSDRARLVLAVDGVPVALTGSHGDSVEWLARTAPGG